MSSKFVLIWGLRIWRWLRFQPSWLLKERLLKHPWWSKTWLVKCVSMGNPHCITFGEEGGEVRSSMFFLIHFLPRIHICTFSCNLQQTLKFILHVLTIFPKSMVFLFIFTLSHNQQYKNVVEIFILILCY
jgi:hypothetical protein